MYSFLSSYSVRNNITYDYAASSVERNMSTIHAIETLVYLMAANFLRTVAKDLSF